MAKWDDPILLLRDYFVLTKLFHAIGSLYIWETVFTAGFELDVLRGKRPYKWTIWLYLGTRYTLLLMFIMFFIDNDAGHVPCQSFIIANFALSYISWGFASLIIVLRVIAIWGRNVVVSSIALSVWLTGLALHIRTVTRIEVTYNSLFGACIVLKTQSGLASVVAILSVDAILLVIMLIGLLRHTHGGSTGMWHLLYKQCIIWMILIAIAEIPPVVFFGLDLNDAWNEMFPGVGGPSAQLACIVLYPNTDLSPNTRRIRHPGSMQNFHFQTTRAAKPMASRAQCTPRRLAWRRCRRGQWLNHLCSYQQNRYRSNLFPAL
ncbi:hypothetical protein EDB84DRAFT_1142763 [Lactarius hengduanensis]|nr:hypothetical protein EDB84DRAFT_1142763 [Lactarius hengduanensis]